VIVEFGHFALLLALATALAQMVLPAFGAHTGDERLMQVGKPAALAQLGLLVIAFAALTYAYVTSDFSVENVWSNSHSRKPLIYRISGVWGNHEGSMLLWVLILALFGAAVALFGANLPSTLRANVLAVQACIAVAFLLFIVLASNPFTRIPLQAEGRGSMALDGIRHSLKGSSKSKTSGRCKIALAILALLICPLLSATTGTSSNPFNPNPSNRSSLSLSLSSRSFGPTSPAFATCSSNDSRSVLPSPSRIAPYRAV
jgi:hypothetical protein